MPWGGQGKEAFEEMKEKVLSFRAAFERRVVLHDAVQQLQSADECVIRRRIALTLFVYFSIRDAAC